MPVGTCSVKLCLLPDISKGIGVPNYSLSGVTKVQMPGFEKDMSEKKCDRHPFLSRKVSFIFLKIKFLFLLISHRLPFIFLQNQP